MPKDTCLDININEIKETYKNAMYIHLKAHTSWVRQGNCCNF